MAAAYAVYDDILLKILIAVVVGAVSMWICVKHSDKSSLSTCVYRVHRLVQVIHILFLIFSVRFCMILYNSGSSLTSFDIFLFFLMTVV